MDDTRENTDIASDGIHLLKSENGERKTPMRRNENGGLIRGRLSPTSLRNAPSVGGPPCCFGSSRQMGASKDSHALRTLESSLPSAAPADFAPGMDAIQALWTLPGTAKPRLQLAQHVGGTRIFA